MDLSPVWISLKTSVVSIIITFFLGLWAARGVVSVRSTKAKAWLDGLLTLPLVLPPTVAGFFLLYLFGAKRPAGIFLEKVFHYKIVFSWQATVLAAVVISFPLMYRSARGAIEQVDANLIYAGRTLGMSERTIFWKIILPQARPGILSGGVLAFTRGLGEFGATAMIAGNIAGKTRTLPLAIYSEVAARGYGYRRKIRVDHCCFFPAHRGRNESAWREEKMSLQVEIEKKLNDKVLSVSFDTEGKQGITGILGASGCGKSMTLKCIAGIETPDRGKIVLNGRVLFDSGKKINLRVQDRHVGYLFQNYALFPNMTVEENIAAGFKYRPGQKMTAEEIKRQTADYMELLHVTELKYSYPGKLSGGQQQRVALARILASDPEVLMLDEPFSALDAFLKEKLQLELLELLSGYDKDILMVTHSRDEIYRFCEHMLIVEDGRQAGFGATKEIFKNPGTPAAAKLTGCKNIEKIERVDDHTMVLSNWNTTVCVKGMIPENTTHIGIRAHYLRLPENGQRENLVECQNGKILDDPFELVVVFEHDVWWKIPKESWQKEYQEKMPQYLAIPEESILYLHG